MGRRAYLPSQLLRRLLTFVGDDSCNMVRMIVLTLTVALTAVGFSRTAPGVSLSTAVYALNQQSVPAQNSVEKLQVQIEQIEPSSATTNRGDGNRDAQVRLSIHVRVSNLTTEPVIVRARDFSLIANGMTAPRGTFSSGPELKDAELEPGEEIDGWLWFADIDCSQGEPVLALNWKSDQPTTIVSLNEEIRRLVKAETELKGPDNCLAVVCISRHLDLLSGWVLQDLVRELNQRELQRLVLQHRMETPGQVSDDLLGWLSSWKQSELPDVSAGPIAHESTGRFIEIHLGGFDRFAGRRLPGSGDGVMIHRSVDDAVSAALRTVYSQIEIEQIMLDIQHEDAGIRRAAIAACCDRLNAEQTLRYLRRLDETTADRQIELLEPMYMMSHPEVLPMLRQLCLSMDPDVSAASLRALTRKGDTAASDIVNDLWQISSTNQDLRNRLVTAALASRDYRWCDLLAQHARQLLYSHVRKEQRLSATADDSAQSSVLLANDDASPARLIPEVIGTGDPPPPAQVPEDPPDAVPAAGSLEARSHAEKRRSPGTGSVTASLLEVLPFLRQHKHDGVLDACRSLLLEIRDPAVQDIVIDFLLHWRSELDLDLIRQYLAQRLQRDQITETVRNTATQYPNPEWTPYLIRDFLNARSQSVSQRKSLSAALRSASNDQLSELLDQFEELDLHSQGLILSHLAAVEFPGWRSIVKVALKQHSSRSREAMEVLQQDGSDESIQILNEHLLELMKADVDWKSGPGESTRLRLQPLISQVSLFSHPESQRVLNQCLRHRDEVIRKYALQAIAASRRRSPAYTTLVEVQELKKSQKYADALAKADECVLLDPFLSEAYLFRSSLLLRQDRLDEALRDLRRADELCPEELSTRSTIALVLVRQGELQTGLQMADETLLLDPDEESTLYNTACVYGRAVESREISAEQRLKYLDETLRLLQSSITAGFSDPDHLRQDPDLACLHAHASWSDVLRSVEENHARANSDLPVP